MTNCEKVSDSLADLRSLKIMKITPSSRNKKPESLLPIQWASMFHAYWVCFQLQEWNTLIESALYPKYGVGG